MKDASIRYITRKTEPTQKNREQYGTVWEVRQSRPIFYIQVSRVKKEPKWMRMGIFLEISLQKLFQDDLFMKRCIGLFQKFS